MTVVLLGSVLFYRSYLAKLSDVPRAPMRSIPL
jgi:hypothetical protein